MADFSRFARRPTEAPTSRTDDIRFNDESVGWAVNSNGQILRDGAILCLDGGVSQSHLLLNDRQRNTNLERVGFLDRNCEWIGGWGDLDFKGGFSSATLDGGENNANELGFQLNRFRFIGHRVLVGYASGDTVYEFFDEPRRVDAVAAALMPPSRVIEGSNDVELDVEIPYGVREMSVELGPVRKSPANALHAQAHPSPGRCSSLWDFKDGTENDLPVGPYIIRIIIDEAAESWIVHKLD